MTQEAIKIIAADMREMGLAYNLERYTGKADPYFVGEYQESESFTEDGMSETTFLITGFSRKGSLVLEEAKGMIQRRYNRVSGKTVITNDGSAVAIFYANALIVPTNDAELKRIQINLNVKEWTVN